MHWLFLAFFFYSFSVFAESPEVSNLNPGLCQIQGEVVGALVSRAQVHTLSPVSRESHESLPFDFEPQPLMPIPYQWMTPVFRDNMARDNEHEYIREDALQALIAMLDDAQRDGVNLFVHSAYRPYKIQCSVFTRKVKRELEATPGLLLLQAISRVNTRSAKPGQSEHQLGTVVDLVTDIPELGYKLEPEMETTPAFSWLQKNAYRYGFSLSFPKGTSLDFTKPNPQTGYIYEPWHWRYVHPHYAYRYKNCESQLSLIEFLRKIAQNPRFDCSLVSK